MHVGEGRHPDREVAEGADEADEVGRVVKPVGMGDPLPTGVARRVTAQGEDVADPCRGILPHDPTDLHDGGADVPNSPASLNITTPPSENPISKIGDPGHHSSIARIAASTSADRPA